MTYYVAFAPRLLSVTLGDMFRIIAGGVSIDSDNHVRVADQFQTGRRIRLMPRNHIRSFIFVAKRNDTKCYQDGDDDEVGNSDTLRDMRWA